MLYADLALLGRETCDAADGSFEPSAARVFGLDVARVWKSLTICSRLQSELAFDPLAANRVVMEAALNPRVVHRRIHPRTSSRCSQSLGRMLGVGQAGRGGGSGS